MVTQAAQRPLQALTSEEAAERLAVHGRNELPPPDRPSGAMRLLRQLREPMALLLIGAAAVSGLVLGEVVDAVAIVTIVALNAVIALVQEGRAERALEALEQLEAPTATVLRDGRRMVIDAATLVPDDVVFLGAGDRVPADLTVLESDGIEVDEAILTGESLPVSKQVGGAVADVPIADRDGMLHAGTLVSAGAGRGRVHATGSGTALGSIAQQLRDTRREPTPLQRQLTHLTERLGIAAVIVAAAVFGLTVLLRPGAGTDEAFLTAVALAVAAVPEGLAAVTTVALALGVGRMAGRGAIVRRLAAVETLGSTDVLVIDKTGTVTENRMQVDALVASDGRRFAMADAPDWLSGPVERVVVLCSDATLDPPSGDPMERALLELAGSAPIDGRRLSSPRLGSVAFTSERKRMATVHRQDEAFELLVKGAPEVVLPLATSRLEGGTAVPLTDEERARIADVADEMAARGHRLLALASRSLRTLPGDLAAEEVELTLVALVALRDPPRASAAGSVATVRDAHMTLLMATGDHPKTAVAIAAEIGIDHHAVRTGPQLRSEGLPPDPVTVPIYARVDPDQKLELVTRLQELGHTVAMTGDGVNDAPALRRADIGVALGATGSDVAREAADLVITDDDLATIVEAVSNGRGIWDNLRKVIDYLVSSNLAEVLVVVTTLVLVPELGVPLLPLQLLWINLLTDGLPALALGVDPVSVDVMQRAPRSRESRLLDAPHLRLLASRSVVLATGAVLTLLAARRLLDLDADTSRTILFSTVVLAQVVFAFVVRRQGTTPSGPNPWLRRSALTAVALHVLIVVVPPAQGLFDTVVPPWQGWLAIAIGGTVTPLLLLLRRRR